MPKFLNPNLIVAQTGLMQGQVVADLGCGSGFYVLPAAQMVGSSGMVYAVDVVESKLAATISITSQFGYKNVKIIQADLTRPFLDITENSCDLVIAGNIFHEINQKDILLKNIYRILKSPGRLVAIEWKKTAAPFGPPLDRRIDQQHLEVSIADRMFLLGKDVTQGLGCGGCQVRDQREFHLSRQHGDPAKPAPAGRPRVCEAHGELHPNWPRLHLSWRNCRGRRLSGLGRREGRPRPGPHRRRWLVRDVTGKDSRIAGQLVAWVYTLQK